MVSKVLGVEIKISKRRLKANYVKKKKGARDGQKLVPVLELYS